MVMAPFGPSSKPGWCSYLSWGYPVLIGDNGLIDIVLHLGLVGVFLIISIIFYAFFITGKYAFTVLSGKSFFPLLCIVFVVVSNISLSMLVELEFSFGLTYILSLQIAQKIPSCNIPNQI